MLPRGYGFCIDAFLRRLSSLNMRPCHRCKDVLLRIIAKRMFICAAVLLFAAVMVQQSQRAQSASTVPYMQTMDDVHEIVGNTPVPVLIQFDATWCGYCRALQPHMQKLHNSTSR